MIALENQVWLRQLPTQYVLSASNSGGAPHCSILRATCASVGRRQAAGYGTAILQRAILACFVNETLESDTLLMVDMKTQKPIHRSPKRRDSTEGAQYPDEGCNEDKATQAASPQHYTHMMTLAMKTKPHKRPHHSIKHTAHVHVLVLTELLTLNSLYYYIC